MNCSGKHSSLLQYSNNYGSKMFNSSVIKLFTVAILANIRLGWKWIAVENTLAYYNTATIMALKSLIVQCHKTFYGDNFCKYYTRVKVKSNGKCSIPQQLRVKKV